MPHYIYGTVVTEAAAAANNRGETFGNMITLQKLFLNNMVHTSVSGEAIRFALRYRFQLEGLNVNRSFNTETNKFSYVDQTRQTWKNGMHFIDDDIMGFMDARAAQVEPPETTKKERKGKQNPSLEIGSRGSISKRQSPLALGRAISLRPYRAETSFNCVAGEKTKEGLTLYSTELHNTEYQYTFAVNTNDVAEKEHILHLLDAIADPPRVGGNSSKFYFDFAPASIILRLTTDHSARIQNCFETVPGMDALAITKLTRKVKAGDLVASEIILGGAITETAESKELQTLGAETHAGIKAAMQSLKSKLAVEIHK